MRRYVCVLACMMIVKITQASLITVSGEVSGNWSADTVMVIEDLIVSTGQSLTIEPGVQVRFNGPYKFTIQGLLTAVGTPIDSILFTRNRPNEESKWRGLRFNAAENASTMQYCRVEWVKRTEATVEARGGAVWIRDCSPTISHCTLINNYCHNDSFNGAGGGVCLDANSETVIEYCDIIQNQSDSGGGVCVGSGCFGTIRHCRIENNEAYYAGGGIYVAAGAESNIHGNLIRHNTSAGYGGGGINLWSATWLYGTTSDLSDNVIAGNSAVDAGGGIYSRYDASCMRDNTIISNSAERGGGLYVLTFPDLPPIIFNAIVWGNSATQGHQILLDPTMSSAAIVSYSNILGGWEGQGIINQYPEFVDTAYGDYRMTWGSPCIDLGDPSILYIDPDSTRADIGLGYFDQSAPVSMLVTPHSSFINLPPTGGTFDYTLRATNLSETAQEVLVWCDVIMPSGQVYGPVMGPLTIALPESLTMSRVRTQSVPSGAPPGLYSFQAHAIVLADTSMDVFPFFKQGNGRGIASAGFGAGWLNWGEEFAAGNLLQNPTPDQPNAFILYGAAPNPFNATAVIKYELLASSMVRLTVWDTAGRLIASLAEGWRESGVHEAVFDGSVLPSGVYIARLIVGRNTASFKMVMIK